MMAGLCRSLFSIGRGICLLECLSIILGVLPVAFCISFTEEPKATTVDIGKQALLSCTAVQGSDKVTYTWEKDGSNVQTNSRVALSDGSLNISNVEYTDRGSYACIATVRGRTGRSKAAKLYVRNLCPSPTIAIKFSRDTFDLDETITLRCRCRDSYPKPQYHWTKDNVSVKTDARIQQLDNKLILNKAKFSDSGSYVCEASNSLGVRKARIYKINVGQPYIRGISLEETYTVKEGKPVNIECRADAEPKAKIEWQQADGSPLPKKFGISGCCTLQNNATSLDDSAEFKCVVSNNVGKKTKIVKLIVATYPIITVNPVDQLVLEGQDVKLSCVVKGTPLPTVTWNKGGQEVKPGKHYTITNSSLLITDVHSSDTGIYTCRASTKGVSSWFTEEKANITVLAKVKLDSNFHQNQKDFDKGTSGKFYCVFEGYKTKVVWKKLGVEKLPAKMKAEKNYVSFQDIDHDDAGTYICTGSNYFSNVSNYVNVTVSEYPKFQLKPKNTTATVKETIWLHCNATGKPRPKITWGKLEHGGDQLPEDRFVQHSNGTLQIVNLKYEDAGKYFCLAATRKQIRRAVITLRVKAVQVPTEPIPDKKTSPESMSRTIGIAVGCAAAYIVLVVGLMIYCKSRRARQQRREKSAVEIPINGDIENRDDGDGNDMTLNPVYRRGASYDKMEFPRHDIEALRTLGNGSYGRAFLARASGIRDGEKETMAAVKALMSKDDIVREDFNKEMEMLTAMENSNVITLLGVCKEEEPVYMIFESTERGDLKQFLLSSHDNGHSKLSSTQKLAMCSEVVKGMSYLAANGFVHKDLATRNCMVTKNLQVKVGFLSLSYDLYNAEYYRFNNVLIPLRWMAPEAIFHDEYTERSDVWSYAVLMWEVYSLGEMPYRERPDEEVLKCVKNDLRLAKPEICPDNIVELMEKCWEGNPQARPTFIEVMGEISGVAVDSHV